MKKNPPASKEAIEGMAEALKNAPHRYPNGIRDGSDRY
jgi:hypothetical protein